MKKIAPFLHKKRILDNKLHDFIPFISLICYGIYKNGILPVWKQNSPIFTILTPILFLAIGFLIGGLVDYFRCLQKKEKVTWKQTPLYGLIISMTMPIQMNLILYAIILFFSLFLFRYFEEKFPRLSLSPLLFAETILLIFIVTTSISYENISEQNQLYFYTTLDRFFGQNIGGLASTSIFWMIISFLYLWFDDYYKKEIPILMLMTYFICALISELFLPTGNVLITLLNPTILFSALFFATNSKSSPYTTYGKCFFAILLGIIAWLSIRTFNLSTGIYFGITLISLFVPGIDFFAYQLEKKTGSFVETQKPKKEKNLKTLKKEIELPKKISEK